MVSDKPFIQRLVKICETKGVKHIVFSPGSRNAPLVISFNEQEYFECITIPDERVAAFVAMGMALKLQEPVIICCTSGSAALNYAPAIVEAYYQKIPLIVLTADRPVERIDQGAGQTMRQKNVYANYVKASYELIQEADTAIDLRRNDRTICEAINLSRAGAKGPVHINVPIAEPLYGQAAMPLYTDIQYIDSVEDVYSLSVGVSQVIGDLWKRANKKLIICGQSLPDIQLDRALEELAQDQSVAIISESCSNRFLTPMNPCIDRVITTFSSAELLDFKPDIVVSIGDAIISKKIKKLISSYQPKEHWFVNIQEQPQDMFGCLTKHIKTTAKEFIASLTISNEDSLYSQLWQSRHVQTKDNHKHFLKTCPWSDLLAFDVILKKLPSQSQLHMSNSSCVRYVQLFDQRSDLGYYSNRGVSGIDGCTSTAVGFASASDSLTTLITGDMAFFYDSNALWSQHLPSNLRIILINNGGGGIFKIIPGPNQTNQYKQYFATEHSQTAEHIAKAFGCEYFAVHDAHALSKYLDLLYTEEFTKPPIIEVFTNEVANEKILDRYFGYVKSNA